MIKEVDHEVQKLFEKLNDKLNDKNKNDIESITDEFNLIVSGYREKTDQFIKKMKFLNMVFILLVGYLLCNVIFSAFNLFLFFNNTIGIFSLLNGVFTFMIVLFFYGMKIKLTKGVEEIVNIGQKEIQAFVENI